MNGYEIMGITSSIFNSNKKRGPNVFCFFFFSVFKQRLYDYQKEFIRALIGLYAHFNSALIGITFNNMKKKIKKTVWSPFQFCVSVHRLSFYMSKRLQKFL